MPSSQPASADAAQTAQHSAGAHRRYGWRALASAAFFLLASLLAPMPALAQPAPTSADGLIVRLKQASPHREQGRSTALAAHELGRWEGLLRSPAVAAHAGAHARLQRRVGRDQMLLGLGRPLAAAEADALAEQLRQRPEVDWVALNVREQRQQWVEPTPSDPYFSQQWWLHTAGGSDAHAAAARRRGVPGFQGAWAAGIAGADGDFEVVVAVLDTGVTPHPELAGRLLPGRDFVSDDLYGNDGQPGRDDDPTDPGDGVAEAERADPRLANCSATGSSWHGTATTGLMVANADNGVGVAAALRRGRVLPVRVAGKCGASVADIIDGMRWAAGLEVDGRRTPTPARVINLSFGGSNPCGREYQDTIDELRSLGVVVVASAGNSPGQVARPASCVGVVGVTALNRDGFKAGYSGFGAALAASGIATVGGDDAAGSWGELLGDGGLVTLASSGQRAPSTPGYAAHYGTSFAAPLVSATLALMLAANPTLSFEQLIAGLRASARPHLRSSLVGECSSDNPGRCICTSATCGAGILDTQQALRYAQAPEAYTPPNWPEERIENGEVAQAVALGADRAAAAPPPAAESGGGALGGVWLLSLAAAVAALRRVNAPPRKA